MDNFTKAIEMLKLLEIHKNVITEFKKYSKLYKSETNLGFLFWLNEEEQQMVDEFEKNNPSCLVYHVIKTSTVDFGNVYDLLFVTDEENFLDNAKLDYNDNLLLSYTITDFPESGLIMVKNINGGVIRIK